MNPNIKRLLCMFLVLTVVFSLMTPVTAFATSEAHIGENVVKIDVGESKKLSGSGWLTKTTWTSSDESVATVSSNGTVTGVAAGTAIIKATSKSIFGFLGNASTKTTLYTVIVGEAIPEETLPEETEPEVTEPEATEPEEEKLTVKAGETLQLTVDADGGTTTWSSSDKSVATVDKNGLVTGVSEGEVTITATVKKTTGKGFWFFWWGSQTTTTVTEFEVVVLPGDEQPTEPEVTEPETEPTEPETEPTEPPVVTYTVTFESNGGSEVEAQVVVEGMTAVEPENPTWTNHVFLGWHSDAELTEVYDFETPVTADITLYAAWYDELGYVDEIVDEEVVGSYANQASVNSIIDLEVTDQDAVVTVNSINDSILHVEILDETSMEVVAEGAANVEAGVEMADISVALNGMPPEYFYVRATLMDFDGNILSTFIFIDYTSAFAAYKAQTIYDFPDRTVINFDEDPADNFGVLAPTVVETRAASVIVEEDGSYTFPVGSEYILNLNANEAVLVDLAEGDDLLFKVNTVIENEDGTVTVIPETEDVSLDEFYEVLKVDMSIDIDESMIDMSEATEGVYLKSAQTRSRSGDVMPMADIDIDVNPSVKLEFGGEIKLSDHWKTDITLNGGLAADLEIIYDIKLFSKDYFRVSVVSGFEGELVVDLMATTGSDEPEGEGKEVFKVKFGKVRVPFGVTGLQGVLEPTVPLEWKLEGGVKFTTEFENKTGFIYETGKDRQDISKKSIDTKFGLEGKAELKFGPNLSLGITFLETVVKAEVIAYAGLKAEAVADMSVHVSTGDCVHSCALCLDGKISGFVEVKAELKYKITEDFKGTPFSLKLVDIEFRLLEFYFSVLNSSDSIYGGVPHLGFGDCENQKWKATFEVTDSNGNPVTADLDFTRVDNGKSAGLLKFVDGENIFAYFYPGNFIAKTTIDGVAVERRFSISNEPIVVKLSPSTNDGTVTGTVSEAEDHSVRVPNATVQVCKGNTVCGETTTDANGEYSIKMPADTYELVITADGYVPFTCYITVTDNNTVYTPTFLMIAESDEKYGGVSGTVTDALTGAPLAGVELIFHKGWNNTDGDFVLSLKTDSNGKYEYKLRNFLTATIGLPVGPYTVLASKDGYVTSFFNVTVLPGKTNGNQNGSLTPEVTGGDYRIVLTWGSTPSDLDSHYRAVTTSGYTEHVYYANMQESSAMLDVDDVSSYGPETTTITDFSVIQELTFSVYDYTNGGNSSNTQLGSSGAVVQVYQGDRLVATYNVPGSGVGDTWHVFRMKSDGTITGINTFCTTGSSSSVGSELFSGYAVNTAMDLVEVKKY